MAFSIAEASNQATTTGMTTRNTPVLRIGYELGQAARPLNDEVTRVTCVPKLGGGGLREVRRQVGKWA